MNGKLFSVFMAALLSVALFCSAEEASPAAGGEPQANDESDLVTISADRMEMELNQKAILEGNVILEDSKMVLTSDYVTVFLENGAATDGGDGEDGGSDGPSMQISRVEARGSVVLRTPDGARSASGERGWYDKANETFILEGSCEILADGNLMKSNRVTYDRLKQTFKAERAKITLLNPGKKNNGDKDDGSGIGFDNLFGNNAKKRQGTDVKPAAEDEAKTAETNAEALK